jgi:hypothetical protein
MPVKRHPPHRSQRVELSHRALAADTNAQAVRASCASPRTLRPVAIATACRVGRHARGSGARARRTKLMAYPRERPCKPRGARSGGPPWRRRGGPPRVLAGRPGKGLESARSEARGDSRSSRLHLIGFVDQQRLQHAVSLECLAQARPGVPPIPGDGRRELGGLELGLGTRQPGVEFQDAGVFLEELLSSSASLAAIMGSGMSPVMAPLGSTLPPSP